MPPKGATKGRGKAKSKVAVVEVQKQDAVTSQPHQEEKSVAEAVVDHVEQVIVVATEELVTDSLAGQAVEAEKSLSMEERAEKLKALRLRMRQSAKDNRADLISESTKVKTTARDAARLEKQRKLHEILRLKADAEDRGEDAERVKNWEYTIEENDAWEKKLKRKKTRADFEFHDDAHAARRKYKKDLDHLKPDLEAYNAQKQAAMGYQSDAIARSATSDIDQLQVATVSVEQQLAAEHLYRDANSLLYADNKPSEEAIDRVVSKLNLDLDKRGKRSRKRLNEDDSDLTYINERNRVFNRKIARYYDKYTTEIRASFERGTAL
ncbi:SYF2 splicing factor-domain-containing protein [Hysterangium stoloniferum]|nr:SYF2 splicing factor-domain-containing protein [Hysterangium stoloniferum]